MALQSRPENSPDPWHARQCCHRRHQHRIHPRHIAAEYDVEDGPNDEGEMFTRPGIPADRMPSPYANDNAARAANNGAYPPDLSLIFKARPNGADYLYSLLTSYGDAPAGKDVPEGMYYNAAYSGRSRCQGKWQIAC